MLRRERERYYREGGREREGEGRRATEPTQLDLQTDIGIAISRVKQSKMDSLGKPVLDAQESREHCEHGHTVFCVRHICMPYTVVCKLSSMCARMLLKQHINVCVLFRAYIQGLHIRHTHKAK